MPVALQELIHKYEVGAGYRTLKLLLGFIAMVALAVLYDTSNFRGLTSAEGMDAAQVARNIAEGKGYSTDFIRPFSLYLLNKHAAEKEAAPETSLGVLLTNKVGAINKWHWMEPHPDVANAPVYPGLLAGVLKAMPFGYPNLLAQKTYTNYLPDLWIVGFNQLLLMIAACLVFRVARMLFDEPVAWVSAAVFVGTELFWRFSLSGLSTVLLMVLFLALTEVLIRMDRIARESAEAPKYIRLLLLAAAAGLLAGLAGLTRYAFVLLGVPLLLWLSFLPSPKRVLATLTAGAALALVLAPWLVRNYSLTGNPFGTAGYAMVQNTVSFPEDQLERSLQPDLPLLNTSEYWQKFWSGTRDMVQVDLPKFGGSWVAALFLVGLLMPFRNPTLGRIRVFLLLCLGLFFIAQVMGKTWVSADSPEVNSENLVVVMAPLAFVYGVSLLFTLLESAMPAMRTLVLAVFFGLALLPLGLSFISGHSLVCFPPWIQEKASRLKAGQVMMTDIPWAVAWYGQRESLWQTLKHHAGERDKVREDFYFVQEKLKPVSALYLTSKSLKNMEIRDLAQWVQDDVKDEDWESFASLATSLVDPLKAAPNQALERFKDLVALTKKHWIKGDDESWASFLLGIYVNHEVPTGFPLRRAPLGLIPEIFLTDSERKAEKPIQSSK